jgi:hypothetical protein
MRRFSALRRGRESRGTPGAKGFRSLIMGDLRFLVFTLVGPGAWLMAFIALISDVRKMSAVFLWATRQRCTGRPG